MISFDRRRWTFQNYDYTTIAVEADWPGAETIDRYVRVRPGHKAGVGGIAKIHELFKRFPIWMWRNREMQDLVEWKRNWNMRQPPERGAGFYGLDLYSMGASIRILIDYLDGIDPAAAKVA